MKPAVLSSCAIVFATADIETTVNFYHDKVGFRVVKHYEAKEKFAALYRGAIEIVLVQATLPGKVRPNREAFGAGEDAYFVPETVEAVSVFYDELRERGIEIVNELGITEYGSSEFSFRDCDGRIIGVGRIRDKKIFFGDAGK
jgi:catechol 2,3-dioxygenase-like lactoylglutathione lyase family enzyme